MNFSTSNTTPITRTAKVAAGVPLVGYTDEQLEQTRLTKAHLEEKMQSARAKWTKDSHAMQRLLQQNGPTKNTLKNLNTLVKNTERFLALEASLKEAISTEETIQYSLLSKRERSSYNDDDGVNANNSTKNEVVTETDLTPPMSNKRWRAAVAPIGTINDGGLYNNNLSSNKMRKIL